MPYHCPEGEFKPVVTEYPYAENTGKTIPSRIQNKKRNCAFLTSQESKISQSGGKNIWKGELSVLHVETDRFLKIRRLRLQKNLVCAFVARCGPSFLARGKPLFCRANGPAARRQKLPKNPRGEHSDPFRRLRLTVVSCSPPSAPHASPRRGDNRHPHTIVRAPSALYLLRDKVLGAARREGVSATGRDRLLASITSSTRRLRRSRGDRRVSEPIPRF